VNFADLGLVILLAAACVLTPGAAAVLVSPWLGVALAIGSFWVWRRLGPRPFPGLLPGCLCLCGVQAILGSFLACLLLAIQEGSLVRAGCFFLVVGILWFAWKWSVLLGTRDGPIGMGAMAAPSFVWLGLGLLQLGSGWPGWPGWVFVIGWLLSLVLAGWILDRAGTGGK
jgi:hypothetical protein